MLLKHAAETRAWTYLLYVPPFSGQLGPSLARAEGCMPTCLPPPDDLCMRSSGSAAQRRIRTAAGETQADGLAAPPVADAAGRLRGPPLRSVPRHSLPQPGTRMGTRSAVRQSKPCGARARRTTLNQRRRRGRTAAIGRGKGRAHATQSV